MILRKTHHLPPHYNSFHNIEFVKPTRTKNVDAKMNNVPIKASPIIIQPVNHVDLASNLWIFRYKINPKNHLLNAENLIFTTIHVHGITLSLSSYDFTYSYLLFAIQDNLSILAKKKKRGKCRPKFATCTHIPPIKHTYHPQLQLQVEHIISYAINQFYKNFNL